MVFIEQICTLNLEVLRLCLPVRSSHLPTATTHRHHMDNPSLIWYVVTQNQALTTLCSRSVHALFGTGWIQHLVIQGSCLKGVCAIFDLLLEVIFLLFIIDKHVCVNDSSAEGTCT